MVAVRDLKSSPTVPWSNGLKFAGKDSALVTDTVETQGKRGVSPRQDGTDRDERASRLSTP